MEGVDFQGLHEYQFWAWIFGTIYYLFVWSVALVAHKTVKKKTKSLEERVDKLEDLIKEKEHK